MTAVSYAHALAARFIAASIAVGALAGLIVGGIREVWRAQSAHLGVNS